MHNPEEVSAPEPTMIGTYLVTVEQGEDIEARLRTIAGHFYPGANSVVAGEAPAMRARHSGRVLSVTRLVDREVDRPLPPGSGQFLVRLAIPIESMGDSMAMLMTLAAGEVLAFGTIKLVDISLPETYLGMFAGPKYGIPGLRRLLGAAQRPLLVAIFKPCIGYSAEQGAAAFYEAAAGGADVVKDDELMADPGYCRRVERVRRYAEAERRAFEETGRHTLHAVNITDCGDRLLGNALEAVELGANALMVSYLQVGLDSARRVCEDPRVTVPVLGHNAGATALYAARATGVSPLVINGILARLCGLDLAVFLTEHGKFPSQRDWCEQIVHALRRPMGNLLPTLPVAGGGVTASLVGAVCQTYGRDIAIGAGTAVFGHPSGSRAGARALSQAIEAEMAGEPLAAAAQRHRELRQALEYWGPPVAQ